MRLKCNNMMDGEIGCMLGRDYYKDVKWGRGYYKVKFRR